MDYYPSFSFFLSFCALSVGFRIHRLSLAKGLVPPKVCVLDMILNWIWWWGSSSGPLWLCWSSIYESNICLKIIIIRWEYWMPYNYGQIICIKNSHNYLLRIIINYLKLYNRTNKRLLLNRNIYLKLYICVQSICISWDYWYRRSVCAKKYVNINVQCMQFPNL